MRVIFFLLSFVFAGQALAQDKPNMLIIWGDDIGFWNLSTNNMGMMGYDTPNIDRIAEEGAKFTDYYGQQSCTAGRSAFILGQSPIRTGLTKVGSPGADLGIRPEDVTLASLLKDEGYVTAQFGKNHLGDKDEFLPTNHGFDEFLGNLYHLNAEEEPEDPDYPHAKPQTLEHVVQQKLPSSLLYESRSRHRHRSNKKTSFVDQDPFDLPVAEGNCNHRGDSCRACHQP